MTTVDISTFEKNIVVRPIRIEEFDRLVELQLKCFPGMKPWIREQIDSQLNIFPEGQICVVSFLGFTISFPIQDFDL